MPKRACFFDLPAATLEFHRFGRDHEHDSVRLFDEPAEPGLPGLAGFDVVTVENRREAAIFQPHDQIVHESGRILARIGDEDFKLLPCASVGHRITRRDLNQSPHVIGHYDEQRRDGRAGSDSVLRLGSRNV
jgi:hypothetical protein